MGVLCHLGRATGSTSEVDGSWLMASSLHTVMSAGCISTRTRKSVSQSWPEFCDSASLTSPQADKGKSEDLCLKGRSRVVKFLHPGASQG